MQPTANRIDPGKREASARLLAPLVAASIDLQCQAKQAHWNVRGENFIGLHELFGKIADAAADYADVLAERIAQFGGEVHGTVSAVAQETVLKPYTLTIASGQEHVAALSKALAAYAEMVDYASTQADDAATQNILIDTTQDAQKWLWLVESHGIDDDDR